MELAAQLAVAGARRRVRTGSCRRPRQRRTGSMRTPSRSDTRAQVVQWKGRGVGGQANPGPCAGHGLTVGFGEPHAPPLANPVERAGHVLSAVGHDLAGMPESRGSCFGRDDAHPSCRPGTSRMVNHRARVHMGCQRAFHRRTTARVIWRQTRPINNKATGPCDRRAFVPSGRSCSATRSRRCAAWSRTSSAASRSTRRLRCTAAWSATRCNDRPCA